MFRYLFLCMSICGLAACASNTANYQQASRQGATGYTESQIAEDRYRVSYTIRDDDQSKAKDFALLRSAELTLQKGFDWFQVSDRDLNVETNNASNGARVGVTHQTSTTTNCGLLGCSTATHPARGAHVGIASAPDSEKVTASIEFVMGSGEVPEGATYYDAYDLVEIIRQQRL